jgi:hypothetical protein
LAGIFIRNKKWPEQQPWKSEEESPSPAFAYSCRPKTKDPTPTVNSDGLRCFTAPGLIFTTREELQSHYKSDWHRYNLKRKVANMPPIMKVDFEARKAAALAKAGQEKQVKTAHLKKGKKEKVQKKKDKRRGKLRLDANRILPCFWCSQATVPRILSVHSDGRT